MTIAKWQSELQENINTPESLVKLGIINKNNLLAIKQIHHNFPFSITAYYARLINWEDPDDPLLKVVVPSLKEINTEGFLDIGGEFKNLQEDSGIQMKYPSTALILPVSTCFSYCRFCFRKRIFDQNTQKEEILKNFNKAVEFLKINKSIDNILITGGDPLTVGTSYLRVFLSELRKIEHIKIIRFGTRALTFLPNRIINDPELLELFQEINAGNKRIYLINHFDHPRELTEDVKVAVNLLIKSGVILVNQTVMLKGVNDSVDILNRLFKNLPELGVTPYYIFQCKFIKGSRHFRVPLYKACEIFSDATRDLNGLAKRVRFIMAHFSGKREIIGTEIKNSKRYIYLKYHQARDPNQIGKILSFPLQENAYWFDDLIENKY